MELGLATDFSADFSGFSGFSPFPAVKSGPSCFLVGAFQLQKWLWVWVWVWVGYAGLVKIEPSSSEVPCVSVDVCSAASVPLWCCVLTLGERFIFSSGSWGNVCLLRWRVAPTHHVQPLKRPRARFHWFHWWGLTCEVAQGWRKLGTALHHLRVSTSASLQPPSPV